jgi:hypothetical protein
MELGKQDVIYPSVLAKFAVKQVAVIGCPQIQLIDFDTVDPTNVTTQDYLSSDTHDWGQGRRESLFRGRAREQVFKDRGGGMEIADEIHFTLKDAGNSIPSKLGGCCHENWKPIDRSACRLRSSPEHEGRYRTGFASVAGAESQWFSERIYRPAILAQGTDAKMENHRGLGRFDSGPGRR